MEGQNTHKPVFISKLFKIQIDEYEKEIDTKITKGKKNEILDLLKNYNKLCSEEEFDEIKDILPRACREGDIDLIKILLCKTIENNSKTLQFKIDDANQTASLFKVNENIEEVSIPKTIEHKSVEYLITSICGTSKNLKTLKPAEDSAVKTIYGYVFPFLSNIKEIYFSASLKELKDGWCCNTSKLTKISISPSNGQFVFKSGKYLLGKSNSKMNLTFFYLHVETSKKFPSHQTSKSFHHIHLTIALIWQNLQFQQILIYKQLNHLHFTIAIN